MSVALAGNPHAILLVLQALSTCWIAASQAAMSTVRAPRASVVLNTPRSVPAPGQSTPMPGTAAIAFRFSRPFLLSTIVQLMSSPLGLSGHTSAFWRYSASLMPHTAGA